MIEVSVVIPTYNRKDLLEDCLISLFNQDFDKKRYEIIVVDDGSRDQTALIVAKLIKKSPVKLTYLKQRNRGAANARNNGVQKTRGKIIAFTDDDCQAHKNWLQSIRLTFQQNPNIAACAGEIKLHLTDSIQKDSKGYFSDAFSPSCPGSNNFAIFKEAFLQIGGFDRHLRFNEDNDLFIRLLQKNHLIQTNEKIIVKHKSRTNLLDLFRRNFYYGVEDAAVFKKNFPNKLVVRIGNFTICNSNFFFPSCIKLEPFNIFFASLLFLPLFPQMSVGLFLFVLAYYIWLCLKSQSLSLKTLIQKYPIDFGRIVGNIVGSIQSRVIFYGP